MRAKRGQAPEIRIRKMKNGNARGLQMTVLGLNEKIMVADISTEMAADILEDYKTLKSQNGQTQIICVENKEKFIDLIKISGKIIKNIDFSKENFNSVDFSDMVFIGCCFEFARFDGCNMDAIEFQLCNINQTSFHGAFMECAAFMECSCIKADFSNTHLMAVYISDSNWTGANVSGANLIEIEAHNWKIDEMILNENTAIIEGKFYNVDWSKTNVSRLNISIDQVKYFLQSANGGKYLQVYDNYKISSLQQREDAILESLLNENQNDIIEEDTAFGSDLIFLSYASEQENIVRRFYESGKGSCNLWMDLELVKEEKLKGQVEKVLLNCTEAVIFLSKEYLIKAWTRYEFFRLIDERNKRGIKIIVAMLDGIGLETEILRVIEQENFELADMDNLFQVLKERK